MATAADAKASDAKEPDAKSDGAKPDGETKSETPAEPTSSRKMLPSIIEPDEDAWDEKAKSPSQAAGPPDAADRKPDESGKSQS